MVNYIKKMSYILGPEMKRVPFLVVIFVVSALADVIGVSIIGPFSAAVTNPTILSSNAFLKNIFSFLNIQDDKNKIIILTLGVVTVVLLQLIIVLSAQFILIKQSGEIQRKVTSKFFKEYITVPYNFILSQSSAYLINLFQESQTAVKFNVISSLKIISSLILCISLLWVLLQTSVILLLLISLAMGIVWTILMLFNKKIRRAGKIRVQEKKKTLSTFNHSIGSFKETRVIGCEDYFEAELQDQVDKYVKSDNFFMSYQQVPANAFKTAIVIVLVTFIGLSATLGGSSTEQLTPVLGVFAVAAIRLTPTATMLIQSLTVIKNQSFALDKFYLMLKDIEELKATEEQNNQKYRETDAEKVITINPDFQYIELDNLGYTYPGQGKAAISGITFKLPKGASVGIIGKSGAGKTTLIDIILGLLQVQQGDIQVDGVSIYKNLRSWQNLLGYIPQSIFLTENSIAKNIAFGVPDELIDYQRIDKVIKMAQLEELVSGLSEGLETNVGERGIRLSGGQRQRIGIARALYHEREILVLDEATSALDSQTEKLITESIKSLAGEKTLIIIAHRLSTLEHCNSICWLEKGSLYKVGSYDTIIPEYEAKYGKNEEE